MMSEQVSSWILLVHTAGNSSRKAPLKVAERVAWPEPSRNCAALFRYPSHIVHSLQVSSSSIYGCVQGFALQMNGIDASAPGQHSPTPQYTPESLSAGSRRGPQATPSAPLRQIQKASPRYTMEESTGASSAARAP